MLSIELKLFTVPPLSFSDVGPYDVTTSYHTECGKYTSTGQIGGSD
jgi:hypothetical protein